MRRGDAGMGSWKKRKPSCNGVDRDLCPNTKVCRLPHGGSSQESFDVYKGMNNLLYKNYFERGNMKWQN